MVPLYRFLLRTVGVAALQRGLSTYLTIGIASFILFAGQGLDARTVVQMCERPCPRLILLFVWSVISLSVARTILSTRAIDFLRAMPVSTAQIVLGLGAMLALAEAPWFILWARGGSALHGVSALAVAMVLHAASVVPLPKVFDAHNWRALVHLILSVVAVFAWLVPIPLVGLAVAAPALIVTLPLAWRRSLELPPVRAEVIRRKPGALSLLVAYAMTIARGHLALVLRTLLVVAVGVGWTAMAIINNDDWHGDLAVVARLSLAIWIPLGVLVAVIPTGALFRSEKGAAWVFETCAVPRVARRFATVGLVAGASATVACVAGGVVGVAGALGLAARLGLVARFAIGQLAIGVATESCARFALRGKGHDSARLIMALLVLVVAGELVLFALPAL